MKLEKRSEGAPAPEETPPQSPGGKPVIVYILLLFIAAFLLMGMSLLIHQRNNTEALGRLQSDLSNMQQVQEIQDKLITLQEQQRQLEAQLSQAQDQLVDTTQALESASAEAQAANRQAQAMQQLYTIQMEYLNGWYTSCRDSIQDFEASGLTSDLPDQRGTMISPAAYYRQLKDAVEARLAEQEARRAP